jgi:predicted enzyme related to lactoylglutathione lyase
MDRYENGVPSWTDLGTSDIDGAKAFYSGLFGWEIPDLPPEAGGYCIALLHGKEVAGLGGQQNPGPPYWTTYVNVDDLAATTEKVKANGGTVYMEPMEVMQAGSMAVYADPQGAAISAWQPAEHIGARLVNETGTMSWNELITTDVEAAKAFYNKVFGWDTETHGEYTEWKLSGRSIGGLMAKNEMMPAEMPPNWGVYFTVDDADASADKVKSLGGTVVMGPMDIEPGRFAVCADPAGAVFSIIKMSEAAA